MHRRMLEDATLEQLKEYTDWSLKRVKDFDEEMYEDLERCLYSKIYGDHFSSWLLDMALRL